MSKKSNRETHNEEDAEVDEFDSGFSIKSTDEDPPEPLRSISAETMRQVVMQRNPMQDTQARFGAVTAKRLHGVYGKTRPVDAPLVQTVADHTQLDVHAFVEYVNEFGEMVSFYAGRPWLTRIIDTYSNCTIGMALSFKAPSVEEVIAALKHAILPKTYTKAWVASGLLQQEWEAMGIMQEFYADNALEFTGDKVPLALLSLAISLMTSPPNVPEAKGRKERGFGTLNVYIHRLSGTTFGKSDLRYLSYDGKTYACHSIDWIWQQLHVFIEDIELKWSKGIQDVPRRKWREGVRRFPVVLPLDMEQFEADMSIHSSRTIQRGGIEYAGLFYSGRQLEELKLNNPDVKSFGIRVNPEDLNSIRVIDPQTMRPVRVARVGATDTPYPRREHLLARREVRRDARSANEANASSSARKSEYLQASDQAALERRARSIGESQAALREATRQPTPRVKPPPDASEVARLNALRMLNASRLDPDEGTQSRPDETDEERDSYD